MGLFDIFRRHKKKEEEKRLIVQAQLFNLKPRMKMNQQIRRVRRRLLLQFIRNR